MRILNACSVSKRRILSGIAALPAFVTNAAPSAVQARGHGGNVQLRTARRCDAADPENRVCYIGMAPKPGTISSTRLISQAGCCACCAAFGSRRGALPQPGRIQRPPNGGRLESMQLSSTSAPIMRSRDGGRWTWYYTKFPNLRAGSIGRRKSAGLRGYGKALRHAESVRVTSRSSHTQVSPLVEETVCKC